MMNLRTLNEQRWHVQGHMDWLVSTCQTLHMPACMFVWIMLAGPYGGYWYKKHQWHSVTEVWISISDCIVCLFFCCCCWFFLLWRGVGWGWCKYVRGKIGCSGGGWGVFSARSSKMGLTDFDAPQLYGDGWANECYINLVIHCNYCIVNPSKYTVS